jgi:hypothetical protein
VVETPGGAWPTSCHPNYPLDGFATLDYTEAVGKDAYEDLVSSWCHKHGINLP